MAFDFPASPTVGQQFTAAAGVIYVWNGYAWVTPAGGGSLSIAVQTFMASGTYTPRVGMQFCMIEVIGGGGGSGGMSTAGGGTWMGGGGGGSGGYSRKLASTAIIGASQVITIGAGGTAGTSSTNGGVGGTTSVGSLCTALGGGGGLYAAAGVAGNGGAGGIAGTGDVAFAGAPGQAGFYNSLNATIGPPGGALGGSSAFGGGAVGAILGANPGNAGGNYGSGASGQAFNTINGLLSGAAGSAGIVIITEYVLIGSASIGGTSTTISDTPPSSPTAGSLWWESDTGMLWISYNDGTSTQWVTAASGSSVPGAVRYDIVQGLTAAQKAQARANIDALKKNYIINGAMMISQENGATAGTLNIYHAVDVFGLYFGSMSGTITAQQISSATSGGSPNRIRITATVADASVGAADQVSIDQRLEGLRVADLRFGSSAAKTITLQFGCKGPAGTYCVAFMNGAANRCYIGEYVIAPGEANTDVVKIITIPGDTTGTWAIDNTIGLFVRWAFMNGSTNQIAANAWTAANALSSSNQFNFMGTVGNVFELFDVGLYEGTVAPAFQVPDYASELLACKRYWESNRLYMAAYGLSGAGNTAFGQQYMVEKRATPTLTLTANAFANVTLTSSSATTKAVSVILNVTATGVYVLDATFANNARL